MPAVTQLSPRAGAPCPVSSPVPDSVEARAKLNLESEEEYVEHRNRNTEGNDSQKNRHERRRQKRVQTPGATCCPHAKADVRLRCGADGRKGVFMMRHHEYHRTHRVGWLRAAVVGADDGIVSTASLIVGVAAAESSPANVLVAGTAGLVARVTFWGALALALTAGVGALFGRAV